MSLPIEIVNLNNEGVDYLDNGDLPKAASVLCQALTAARQALGEDQEDLLCDMPSQPFGSRLHKKFSSSTLPVREGGVITDGSELNGDRQIRFGTAETCTTSTDGGDSLIFRRAYKLSPELTSYPTVCCLTCVFNLALTHHLWSLNAPNSTLTSLEAGIRLYELSYTMLMQDEEDLSGGTMTLAIVNNLAQIHQVCKNEMQATRCRKHLLSVFMYFQACGKLNIEDLTGPIMSTVSMVLLHDPLTSPAA